MQSWQVREGVCQLLAANVTRPLPNGRCALGFPNQRNVSISSSTNSSLTQNLLNANLPAVRTASSILGNISQC
jgi:hypothetical protein